ncbi:MAG TPA: fibronectin type III domain-containing protein, partial [Terriglobia bacterium]|nr:fibronectin type III domain-containing protein [Terriglobia bacterium]
DSVMAIADESYFDWAVLPEAPNSLSVSTTAASVGLSWQLHGGSITGVIVERRLGPSSSWQKIATLGAESTTYTDSSASLSQASYRVRAVNSAGESAYSNVARVARLR